MEIEGVEAEAEEVYQEEQQQYVGEDQEQGQELVQDLTNFVDTQGKPRSILKPSVTTLSLKSYNCCTYAFKFLGVD